MLFDEVIEDVEFRVVEKWRMEGADGRAAFERVPRPRREGRRVRVERRHAFQRVPDDATLDAELLWEVGLERPDLERDGLVFLLGGEKYGRGFFGITRREILGTR